MHYHAEVYLKEITNLEEQVRKIMEPYKETNESGFWDWYQIGGRWRGTHLKGYNAEKDENLYEICTLCNGTGKRKDMEIKNGCNGCGGTGKHLKWPTQWPVHSSDIIPVSEVTDNLDCYTLITPEQVFHKELWNGEDFIKTDFNGNVKSVLGNIRDGYLVTVDYHS